MTMHEYIDEIIARIKAEPAKFEMAGWPKVEACGTSACVGGWLSRIYWERKGLEVYDVNIGQLIGLNCDDAEELFYMTSLAYDLDYTDIEILELFDYLPAGRRVEIAVKVLEEVKRSGRVTWSDYWDADERVFK